MKPLRLLAALIAASALVLPASASPGTGKAGVSIVAVSILPQQYFVQRIGGGRVRTLVLVGPGQSPHSYEPTPRQMADLGAAAAWMTIGVEFETALAPKVKALYPNLRLVDTTEGVRFRVLEGHSHEGEEEENHPEGEHREAFDSSGSPDPHIWLGRAAAKAQAAFVRDILSEIDPNGKEEYVRNHDALVRDIDGVFDALLRELAPLRGKPVFVYHPAFGYFLDEFGIEQVAVETGGKEPTQKGLAALIEEAREHGAKVVFVQPQFSRSAARTVAGAIGGAVVEINALDADWLGNLKRMGEALKSAIR